jgi:hypothetical protein
MDGSGEHHIKRSKPRVRKIKVTCFLSYVEDRYKYKYKHYHINIHTHTQNMFPIVGLLEKTRGGGKEENDRE